MRAPRRRRFALLNVARRVMDGLRLKNRKGEWVKYAVTSCYWRRQAGTNGGCRITDMGAVWTGIQHCASVWHCPVCAAIVAIRRAEEVADAIERAKAMGYKPVLITYTARHHKRTRLAEQLEAMTKAYEALWRGEPAKRIKEKFDILGTIRALECTWAELNGHHPHMHALLFVPVDLDCTPKASESAPDGFYEKIRDRWLRMAKKQDLTMNGHGFDLTDSGVAVAQYVTKISKWTEADELTRWTMKGGKRNGRGDLEQPVRAVDQHCSPWQLLEYAGLGDAKAAAAFREYATVFYGRRQLVWSDGLRDKLGMTKEQTDEELVVEESQEATALADVRFTDDQGWLVVRGNDAHAEFLEVLEDHIPALLGGGDEALVAIERDVWDLFGVEVEVTRPPDVQHGQSGDELGTS